MKNSKYYFFGNGNQLYIDEGAGRGPKQKRVQILPANICLAKHYLRFDESGFALHEDLLKEIAAKAAKELAEWVEWLNENSFEDKVNFNLTFDDGIFFDACLSEKIKEGNVWRDCAIFIGLGCLPVLLGIANRLDRMVNHNEFMQWFRRPVPPFEEAWDPDVNPMGVLVSKPPGDYSRTTRITIDALILILLHEATHGARGHLHWKTAGLLRDEEAIYMRAMESDADWGAGFMFIKGVFRNAPVEGANAEVAIVDRLVQASTCNYLGFQSTRKANENKGHYHLPHTRARCTLWGAARAWNETPGLSGEIVSLVDTAVCKMPYLDEAFAIACPSWIGHRDRRSKIDVAMHDTFTQRKLSEILEQLRPREAGPLKGKRANFAIGPTAVE